MKHAAVIAVLLFVMAASAFAQMPHQAIANVAVQGGRFIAPSGSIGLTQHVAVTGYRYAVNDSEAYVSYRFANFSMHGDSDWNTSTPQGINAYALLGGGTKGLIGGVLLGETHKTWYGNVIIGNIYRVAGGSVLPGLKDTWLTGFWGVRGYGGNLERKVVKRTLGLADGLTVTAGWTNGLGFNVGLKTTLIFSE